MGARERRQRRKQGFTRVKSVGQPSGGGGGDTTPQPTAQPPGEMTAGEIIRASRTDPSDPSTGNWLRAGQIAEGVIAGRGGGQTPTTPADTQAIVSGKATGWETTGNALLDFMTSQGRWAPEIEDGFYTTSIAIPFGGGGLFKGGAGIAGRGIINRLQGTLVRPTIDIGKKLLANSKSAKLTAKYLGKYFSKKAMIFYGAWASSVTIGLWGQAESVEAFTFPNDKFFTPEAMRTGDWSLVDEADAAAEEMNDISIWQKIALWSPISFAIGIPKKVKATAAAQILRTRFHADQKNKQATGQSEEDYWRERDEEKQAQFLENERIKDENFRQRTILMNEANAAAAAAKRAKDKEFYEESAQFWAEQRDLERQKAEEDRIAIAKFWLEYRKLANKIADENRPSSLNFGLL